MIYSNIFNTNVSSGDFFTPSFRCPHRVERVGTLGDGGKWVCGLDRIASQRTPCTIYSFGVNGESSFEAALLTAAPQCEVWGYDFSVSSFGPEVHNDTALRARSHFFPFALGSEDSPYSNPPTFTLQTLMHQNGHSFIDILKIDIEGYEFDTLKEIVMPYLETGEPLPFGQLQIEVHIWNKKFSDFLSWWEMLEAAGLRPVMMAPNLVYVNYNRNNGAELAEVSTS